MGGHGLLISATLKLTGASLNTDLNMAPTFSDLPPLVEVSEAQAFAIFDSAARRFFNMSGEQLLHQWSAGAFPDPDSVPFLMEVMSLRP
jgi:hypothetical protein